MGAASSAFPLTSTVPAGCEDGAMSPQQKQMLVAVILGLVMGVIIAWLAGFWMWIPAGVAVGLATGAIMKPPTQ